MDGLVNKVLWEETFAYVLPLIACLLTKSELRSYNRDQMAHRAYILISSLLSKLHKGLLTSGLCHKKNIVFTL